MKHKLQKSITTDDNVTGLDMALGFIFALAAFAVVFFMIIGLCYWLITTVGCI